ncbi:MAG: OmpA family protein [Chitinophagales bacterium]|nr:OmpA family protein [Bacteroidota bacterium]MCB9256000.1 OmpA family protein [Chitinophagales bacterium]
MKTKMFFIGISIAVLLSSCVSKKKFAELDGQHKACMDDLNQKERAYGELAVRVDGLNDKIAYAEKQNQTLKESLDACLANTNLGSTNITKLLDEIDKSNTYIQKLVDSKMKNDSLNLYISNTLKRSLDDVADSDVDVKVLKGVVFISLSDAMLYKSGSYEVLPSAEKVLAKVSRIINDYKEYDVLVEGHTDNVPYNGSGNLKDNWDLSALRATAVVRILQEKFAVDPARMTAGGRSEYKPKVSNDTKDGKAENRRTVIIVMPKLDQFINLMNQAPTKQ